MVAVKRAYERCVKKWFPIDRALFGVIYLYRAFKHILSIGGIGANEQIGEAGRELLKKHQLKYADTWGAVCANLSAESKKTIPRNVEGQKLMVVQSQLDERGRNIEADRPGY